MQLPNPDALELVGRFFGWGDFIERGHHGRLDRSDPRTAHADLFLQKWISLDLYLNLLALEEGIVMNYGYGIINRDIFVDIVNNYRIDINMGDVDTVRSVIAMSVVNLPRSKRHPGNVGRCMHPADISGSPVNFMPGRRHPAPSIPGNKRPPAVMIGRPPPRFIGNPYVIIADPHPSAIMVWRPVDRNLYPWPPDIPMGWQIHPFTVIVKVA